MTAPVRPRLSSEEGFTLVELLVAAVVGLIVVFAALLLMDNATSLSKRTYAQVDATQRGRLAMDTMVRELGSQVCLSAGISPLVSADDNQITFYVNLSGPDAVPQKHQLSYETNNIVLRKWVGTGTPPAITWPGTATSTQTILENVGRSGTAPGLPIFRYYAYDNAAAIPGPTQLMSATPLSATNLPKVTKIEINAVAKPSNDFTANAKGSAQFRDSVYVRSVDPSDPTKGPRCN